MEFTISEEHKMLQERSRRLAADFATRAATHDREGSNPVENYAELRREGFYGLNVPRELGGWGVGLLGYSLAAEESCDWCRSSVPSLGLWLRAE